MTHMGHNDPYGLSGACNAITCGNAHVAQQDSALPQQKEAPPERTRQGFYDRAPVKGTPIYDRL